MNMSELLHSAKYKFVCEYFKNMNFSNPKVYASWLAQTHYFVKHSVRLSALGAAKCDVDSTLGNRMIAHTMEERGHHTLARKDIEHLGFKVEDFAEMGITKVFYQSQYYRVLFNDPSALLGQIYMLECFAVDVCEWLYNLAKETHGPGACRFVKVHAFEDPDHVEKALAEINQLNDSQKVYVKENFEQACEVYFSILQNVNEQVTFSNVATSKLELTM